MTTESVRLCDTREGKTPWRKWGPYLSERQWGTVREDYSAGGDAWNYLSHDQARSRAYRWGEDGIAGFSDDEQRLCFALALWNGNDPILKERLFGLTNGEGNHGEDVKEYYLYLDNTPTHSYMKYLYKYPQAAYPYLSLVEGNRGRNRSEFEYELIDTGVFAQDRYFDVFVEYAKASPEDILVQITVHNRGPDPAPLTLLPTLWFRNVWSWGEKVDRPLLREHATGPSRSVIAAAEPKLGERFLACEGDVSLLFTGNETNMQRLFGVANPSPYVKDGIDEAIVHGRDEAVNPQKRGTKAAACWRMTLAPGERRVVRLRLSPSAPDGASGNGAGPFGPRFDAILQARRDEADDFYRSITPPSLDQDHALVMRQALAGMLWTKQYYLYDVERWLEERGSSPFRPMPKWVPRNEHWQHMDNGDVISMPDKWEYPWYASWDLAFHVIALTLVDPDFGKQQLSLMLQARYLHPNGQIPAYEWNFGDVNPPVQAWATIFTYRLDKAESGRGDVVWLKNNFKKLLLNFTWWVNRKDRTGRNVFEGGFLGLDNIGAFDRSAPLPTGEFLEQADGTAWMALFCQNMLEISAELSPTDPDYAEMALKFMEHFLWIAASMDRLGGETGMWDEEDGFYYDVLRRADGQHQMLKVRTMVGLLPFCAVTAFEPGFLAGSPEILATYEAFLRERPELYAAIHDPRTPGVGGRMLGAVLNEGKLRRVLRRMLDEREFLSPYGIRSLSRCYADHPYFARLGGTESRVAYLPAESDTGMFGGNSNWRGPIWMPVNMLILRALLQYYAYYGDGFTVECPTGSGRLMTLFQVAQELTRRLESIFLRGKDGRRPVFGGVVGAARKFQDDPNWRDYVLFYEYFHGDNGAGLGASHQTGWTGLVARMMHMFAVLTSEQVLRSGTRSYLEAEAPWAPEYPAHAP